MLKRKQFNVNFVMSNLTQSLTCGKFDTRRNTALNFFNKLKCQISTILVEFFFFFWFVFMTTMTVLNAFGSELVPIKKNFKTMEEYHKSI